MLLKKHRYMIQYGILTLEEQDFLIFNILKNYIIWLILLNRSQIFNDVYTCEEALLKNIFIPYEYGFDVAQRNTTSIIQISQKNIVSLLSKMHKIVHFYILQKYDIVFLKKYRFIHINIHEKILTNLNESVLEKNIVMLLMNINTSNMHTIYEA